MCVPFVCVSLRLFINVDSLNPMNTSYTVRKLKNIQMFINSIS